MSIAVPTTRTVVYPAMPNSPIPHWAASPNSQTPESSVTPLAAASTGSSSSSGKSRSPSIKPPNVFSSDGSFLDRIRRSIKEDEAKKKAEETLERKKTFADRFRQRGKRPLPPPEPSVANDSQLDASETESSPTKKQKTSDVGSESKEDMEREEGGKEIDDTPQAAYHKAMDSYPTSLKDTGTGVRPLVK